MKKLVLSLIAVFVLSRLSFAETVKVDKKTKTVTVHDEVTVNSIEQDDNVDLGLELDMPKAVQLTKNTFFGLSATKDLNGTNHKEGWGAMAKITYYGTWFKLGGE